MADIYWCDKAIYQWGIICNRGNSRTIRDQIDEDNIEIVLPQSNAYRFFFWGKTTGVIKALPTSGFKFLNQHHILNFFHRHPLRITIVNTGKKVSFTCILQKSVPVKCFTWCCLNSCIEKKREAQYVLLVPGWLDCGSCRLAPRKEYFCPAHWIPYTALPVSSFSHPNNVGLSAQSVHSHLTEIQLKILPNPTVHELL